MRKVSILVLNTILLSLRSKKHIAQSKAPTGPMTMREESSALRLS